MSNFPLNHFKYPLSLYNQKITGAVANLEEMLQNWNDALQRIQKMVEDAHEIGVEFSIEMKNLVWQIDAMNGEILQELAEARKKFQNSLDYIQSLKTRAG
jgi:hypothetical protein